jgi:hypothetical protein
MRRRRGGGGGHGGGDGIFGVSCRCGDACFSIFSGLGVGGDRIFCVPFGCGDGTCGD